MDVVIEDVPGHMVRIVGSSAGEHGAWPMIPPIGRGGKPLGLVVLGRLTARRRLGTRKPRHHPAKLVRCASGWGRRISRPMNYGEQRSSKEAPEPEPLRSEERLRVIKDYANDLLEILKRLRKQLN